MDILKIVREMLVEATQTGDFARGYREALIQLIERIEDATNNSIPKS